MFPGDHLARTELTLSHLIDGKIGKKYSAKNTTAQSKLNSNSILLLG